MEKQNPSPSKDSTNNKSPSSSPQRPPSNHDSPTATNPPIEGSQRGRIEEGIILKTPEEVLAELTAGDDETAGDDDGAGVGVLGGGSMMVAMEVGGRLVVEGGRGINDGLMKKRKNTQVKDPPSGKPTCPECNREFSTWKAAFGHMRKHPGRTHRGFYPPPTFSAESTTTVPPNDGDSGDKGVAVASLVQRLVFDLNQSLEGGAGISSDAAERQQAPAQDGGKKMTFDLNESPPPEEDE